MSNTEVFVDTSVLTDYCRPYSGHHQYSKKVLDEVTVRLVTSDDLKDRFSNLMKQRQDLYTTYFRELPRYFENIREPAEAEIEVAESRMFDIDHLNQVLEYNLHPNLESDLRALQNMFSNGSPHEFLREIDNIQQRAESGESAIVKLSDTVPCRIHTTIEPYLTSLLQDELAVIGAGHAITYLQDKDSSRFLVRHGTPLFECSDEINNLVGQWMSKRATLEIISPKQVVESASA
jgi:predicted nucleic acid-binding protein